MKTFKIIFLTSTTLLIVLAFVLTGASYKRDVDRLTKRTLELKVKLERDSLTYIRERKIEMEFSEEALMETLLSMRVKFPRIVIAQARVETGHYSSKIFLNNNNLFGMRVPGKRITTCTGSRNGYAFYTSWQQSVIDYALFQSRFLDCSSEKKYLTSLSAYAAYPKYVEKVRSVLKKVKFGKSLQ